MRKLLRGLAYIHSKGIMHRDVKPENLILKPEDNGDLKKLKIIDFGFAQEIKEKDTPFHSCGTIGFVAPEILNQEGRYNEKCDIFSAGVIFYIL